MNGCADVRIDSTETGHHCPIGVPDIEFWKGVIPCHAACPVHTDASWYVQLIGGEGKFEDACLTA